MAHFYIPARQAHCIREHLHCNMCLQAAVEFTDKARFSKDACTNVCALSRVGSLFISLLLNDVLLFPAYYIVLQIAAVNPSATWTNFKLDSSCNWYFKLNGLEMCMMQNPASQTQTITLRICEPRVL